jgi:hypothetical protein
VALELVLVSWLLVQAPSSVSADRPRLCDESWFRRGLQGRVLAPSSADARALRTSATQIARGLGYKTESMKVEVIDLGDAFAVYLAPREEGALGGDLTVIFKADNSLCVLRDAPP